MSDQFNSDDIPRDEVEEGTTLNSQADIASTADSGEAEAAQPEGKPFWKRPPFIICAIVVLIVIALLIWLVGGKDSYSSSLEGAQEDIPTPAQGTRDSIKSMELVVDGKTAPVDFVQLTDQGSLIPPTDVSRLGWYSASAIPGQEGQTGSSVITGHINAADQGDGFAAMFPDLKVGDTVTVKVDGQDRDFRVSKDPIHVVKGADLPESVNDAVGDNRLVLITCGGEFVGGTLGYSDNIIVEADPVR